ncbi:hypothetical protein [Amycolatopsis silviterrae]|uniref:Uncharacterized protein n=1 Tax=Amycolatopsis silviterrae TaxID=1656914 RepID=A0ABW5HA46_9PSEU
MSGDPARPNYGTYPQALQDLRTALGPENRLLHELSWEEDQALAAVSLELFPGRFDGLRWPDENVLTQAAEPDYERAARLLGDLIRQHSPKHADAVVFWGNLSIPTVRLPARLAAANAGELMDTGDDVWIYLPDRNVLVEYWHSGRITAGTVPVGC